MSHEQSHNAEQKSPRWEMDYSWGNMVVAVLERKVIEEDDPNYPVGGFELVERQFRNWNSDSIFASRDVPAKDRFNWTVVIQESAEGQATYGFRISNNATDGSRDYQITDYYSRDPNPQPISADVAEGLLATALIMQPDGDATYYTGDEIQG